MTHDESGDEGSGLAHTISYTQRRYSGLQYVSMRRLEDFIQKDNQRAKDGFPKKLKFVKNVSPTKGKDVIVLPEIDEEKFYHRPNPRSDGDNGETSGAGNGSIGDIIGRKKMNGGEDGDEGRDAGEDEGEHGIEMSPQELGKILAEQFALPNLQDKGKKKSLRTITYEVNERSKKHGQILDVQQTLKSIVATNIGLGRITDPSNVDLSDLIISPDDLVYKILSKEPDYEAQALVFFARDYSGSMQGMRTDMLVHQHVLLYCWLAYQYQGRIQTRFVLHDTEAKEVPNFHTYYNLSVAGGTKVSSVYKYIRNAIERDQLDRDYNIYIFHGTDGDDWGDPERETIKHLVWLLRRVNRVGLTITNEMREFNDKPTTVEDYIMTSRVPTAYRKQFRMSLLTQDDEATIIKSMKELLL